ncbi:diguanylate cyclase domain-containing protein [Williamsia sp. SKLECPSW1]
MRRDEPLQAATVGARTGDICSQALLELMVDASVDCIEIVDRDGVLVRTNRAARRALGLPLDESDHGATRWIDLLAPPVRARGRRAFTAALSGRTATFAGFTDLSDRGRVHWDNILTPMRDPRGEVSHVLCLARDVTRQRRVEHRLRVAAATDDLTGLPNRRSFNDQLERHFTRARRNGTCFGVLLVDVDDMKAINDTYGHAAGDALLRGVALRLVHALAGDGFAARLGGDEFAIIVPDHTRMTRVAEGVVQAMATSFSVRGMALRAGVSVGGSVSSAELSDPSTLLTAGDCALYRAKACGRGGYRAHPGPVGGTGV